MEDTQEELFHDMRLMAEAVHKLDIAVQMILERMEDAEYNRGVLCLKFFTRSVAK